MFTLGLLDALKYEKPKCVKPAQHLGISKLVREHFDEIKDARDKGYSWRQIANAVNSRCYFPTKKLHDNLSSAFNKERKKRETD